MGDQCQLLQVKHLWISVYHPQTDGLVERFNQMLKWMFQQVIEEDSPNWDLLLSCIPFAIHKHPRSSHPLNFSLGSDLEDCWMCHEKPGKNSPLCSGPWSTMCKKCIKCDQVTPIIQETHGGSTTRAAVGL